MYEKYCQARDSLGYKDSDIAKATGITKSTFTDWKKGRSKPKIDKIQKIADFLGVSSDYLLADGESASKDSPVDVEQYINSVINKLKYDSGNAGIMYLKGTKLTDMQIELLADDIENALNRIIKLSERSKSEK